MVPLPQMKLFLNTITAHMVLLRYNCVFKVIILVQAVFQNSVIVGAMPVMNYIVNYYCPQPLAHLGH